LHVVLALITEAMPMKLTLGAKQLEQILHGMESLGNRDGYPEQSKTAWEINAYLRKCQAAFPDAELYDQLSLTEPQMVLIVAELAGRASEAGVSRSEQVVCRTVCRRFGIRLGRDFLAEEGR